MASTLVIDRDAVAKLCRVRGVQRMRLFGSAADGRFNERDSDVDLLVEFQPGVADLFDAYFGLKEDLESLFGRDVDLVMTDAIRNPYFEASALATAKELYAA